MRKLLATTVACMALFTQTSAQAANGCYGCNVVDEGVLNASLIGATVYFDGTRGVAERVDPSDNTVYLRLSDGRTGWAPARSTYTSASQSERQVATGAAVVGVLGLLAAAMSGSSSSSSSSGQRTYQTYTTESSGSSSSSASARTTPGFYGDCHGGAAYGCR